MTRAEWLDYFETVNGRKPSVQEMADALKAGSLLMKHRLKLKIQLLLNLLRLRHKSSRQVLVLYQLKRHQ